MLAGNCEQSRDQPSFSPTCLPHLTNFAGGMIELENTSTMGHSSSANTNTLGPALTQAQAQAQPPQVTFTTCLSIPVIGTKSLSQNSTEQVERPGPSAPAQSRMARVPAGQNSNANNSSQTHNEDVPDLGIEPIHVSTSLDLNSVRTQAPRQPDSTQVPATSFRPFGLEDCPVFYPSKDEWESPMQYIKAIGHVAQNYGICKIVPPEDWKMPFVTNTEARAPPLPPDSIAFI